MSGSVPLGFGNAPIQVERSRRQSEDAPSSILDLLLWTTESHVFLDILQEECSGYTASVSSCRAPVVRMC